ncbi:OmpA family protein [Acidisphaera sp. S103]|uniref:OmpA family protein n=1 Tax=Acidisphaera sp. S103 TaxID=1747223 RepID=UPI001C20ACF4|nr:OmpA family protein [Acidisphaera sp. S103]
MRLKLVSACSLLLLGGCVQPYYGPVVQRQHVPGLATQDQTAGIENADRIARFRRLAAMQGIPAPHVDQLMLPPNSVSYMASAVPVVRVVFDERVFFDFNSDIPRPEADAVFDLLAENMRRDVPDSAVTVLGHTDAVGADAYNINLSARRAANVMRELVRRGVRPDQLSEVAIGKRQPLAPNDTEAGRARNRRVEFLVSSGIEANLAAVQQRVVPIAYLSLDNSTPPPPGQATVVQVLRMKPGPEPRLANAGPGDPLLIPYAGLPLLPPENEDIQRTAPVSVAVNQPENPPQMIRPDEVTPVKLIQPEPLHLVPLGDAQKL